ncbi:hypothetical protein ACTFIU_004653 [Dictyostelium citrinum]
MNRVGVLSKYQCLKINSPNRFFSKKFTTSTINSSKITNDQIQSNSTEIETPIEKSKSEDKLKQSIFKTSTDTDILKNINKKHQNITIDNENLFLKTLNDLKSNNLNTKELVSDRLSELFSIKESFKSLDDKDIESINEIFKIVLGSKKSQQAPTVSFFTKSFLNKSSKEFKMKLDSLPIIVFFLSIFESKEITMIKEPSSESTTTINKSITVGNGISKKFIQNFQDSISSDHDITDLQEHLSDMIRLSRFSRLLGHLANVEISRQTIKRLKNTSEDFNQLVKEFGENVNEIEFQNLFKYSLQFIPSFMLTLSNVQIQTILSTSNNNYYEEEEKEKENEKENENENEKEIENENENEGEKFIKQIKIKKDYKNNKGIFNQNKIKSIIESIPIKKAQERLYWFLLMAKLGYPITENYYSYIQNTLHYETDASFFLFFIKHFTDYGYLPSELLQSKFFTKYIRVAKFEEVFPFYDQQSKSKLLRSNMITHLLFHMSKFHNQIERKTLIENTTPNSELAKFNFYESVEKDKLNLCSIKIREVIGSNSSLYNFTLSQLLHGERWRKDFFDYIVNDMIKKNPYSINDETLLLLNDYFSIHRDIAILKEIRKLSKRITLSNELLSNLTIQLLIYKKDYLSAMDSLIELYKKNIPIFKSTLKLLIKKDPTNQIWFQFYKTLPQQFESIQLNQQDEIQQEQQQQQQEQLEQQKEQEQQQELQEQEEQQQEQQQQEQQQEQLEQQQEHKEEQQDQQLQQKEKQQEQNQEEQKIEQNDKEKQNDEEKELKEIKPKLKEKLEDEKLINSELFSECVNDPIKLYRLLDGRIKILGKTFSGIVKKSLEMRKYRFVEEIISKRLGNLESIDKESLLKLLSIPNLPVSGDEPYQIEKILTKNSSSDLDLYDKLFKVSLNNGLFNCAKNYISKIDQIPTNYKDQKGKEMLIYSYLLSLKNLNNNNNSNSDNSNNNNDEEKIEYQIIEWIESVLGGKKLNEIKDDNTVYSILLAFYHSTSCFYKRQIEFNPSNLKQKLPSSLYLKIRPNLMTIIKKNIDLLAMDRMILLSYGLESNYYYNQNFNDFISMLPLHQHFQYTILKIKSLEKSFIESTKSKETNNNSNNNNYYKISVNNQFIENNYQSFKEIDLLLRNIDTHQISTIFPFLMPFIEDGSLMKYLPVSIEKDLPIGDSFIDRLIQSSSISKESDFMNIPYSFLFKYFISMGDLERAFKVYFQNIHILIRYRLIQDILKNQPSILNDLLEIITSKKNKLDYNLIESLLSVTSIPNDPRSIHFSMKLFNLVNKDVQLKKTRIPTTILDAKNLVLAGFKNRNVDHHPINSIPENFNISDIEKELKKTDRDEIIIKNHFQSSHLLNDIKYILLHSSYMQLKGIGIPVIRGDIKITIEDRIKVFLLVDTHASAVGCESREWINRILNIPSFPSSSLEFELLRVFKITKLLSYIFRYNSLVINDPDYYPDFKPDYLPDKFENYSSTIIDHAQDNINPSTIVNADGGPESLHYQKVLNYCLKKRKSLLIQQGNKI